MADSPNLMHEATIGSAIQASRPMAYRCDPHELLARYGMWVHRCVTLNASAAACVPIRLYTVDTSGDMRRYGKARSLDAATKAHIHGRRDVVPSPSAKAAMRGYESDLVEIMDHPILDLLNNVNRWTEGYGYRESLYADLQIFGRAYTLIVGTGEPEELWRMPPQKMKIIRDPEAFVGAFQFGDSTNRVNYDPGEVLWFRLFDPVNPWEGYGPLEAWLKTIDSMHHVAAFQDELFRRGGAPDYIVTSKRDLSQEQKRSFRREWRRLFGRLFRRQETIGFLGGEDVSLQKLTESPRELEFTASQDQLRDTIGQAFGVPKALLTADDVNRSNAMEASNAHMRLTIWPMVQRVEDVLNEQLVRRWGDSLFIMHENPIREDATIRIADRASKLASGWSVNEVRVEEGAEAIEDPYADIPLVSSSVVSLERAIEPPQMPDFGLNGPDEPDDPDDDGDDEPDAPEDEDDPTAEQIADELERRGFRVVAPVTLNGYSNCGCGKAQSQRDMWLKADVSGKPREIAGEAKGLADELADFFRVKIASVLPIFERVVVPPPLDVVLPDSERAAEEAEVSAIAEPHVREATRRGGQKALDEIGADVAFDLDSARVRAFIADQSRVIGRAATDRWRSDIREILLVGTSEGLTVNQIADRIRESTDQAGWKAERIATTEIGFAATASRDQAYVQSDIVVGKEWLLSSDACPLCEAMAADFNDAGVSPGESFLKTGSVYTYDGGPPNGIKIDYRDIVGGDAHPYCRCTIVPVLADE